MIATTDLIAVAGLGIATRAGAPVLNDVSFQVAAGEVHALVGESGSGKTTAALTLFGRLRPGLVHTAGTVTVAGSSPLDIRGRELRRLRRGRLGWLGQDPALALTPHLSIGALLRESAALGTGDDELLGLAEQLGLGDVQGLLDRRPAQLSGGQRRRAAFARALASQPDVLVLDEPTSGLDAIAVDQLIDVLTAARLARTLAILVITHDLAFADRVADATSHLSRGRIVEAPPTRPHPRPTHLHTPAVEPMTQGPALRVQGLVVDTPGGAPVVSGLDLALERGGEIALLGHSGAGKTTLVRALVGSHPPRAGRLWVSGQELAWPMAERIPSQRRRMQLIGQDPAGSLNPAVTIGTQLTRAVLRARPGLERASTRAAVADLLEAVCLPGEVAPRLPGTLSGGQAQRVAIARALAHDPSVLLCDEATSSLDPLTQAEILALLARLRRERGLAVVVITHDETVASASTTRLRLEGGGRFTCERA